MKIYLSPHLDDAVFSCGGVIYEQISKGEQVEVWTFSTMDPDHSRLSPFAQFLHAYWGEIDHPVLIRREEDKTALTQLGCKWIHLDYPDCIYRFNRITDEPLIKTSEDLFPVNYQIDFELVNNMIRSMEGILIKQSLDDTQKGLAVEGTEIIVPLAVGGHIDHRNTRLAAEKLGLPLSYYADFPYAAKDPAAVETWLPQGSTSFRCEVSENGLAAWQEAISCYKSQISSFWSSIEEMKKAVIEYSALPFACTLWKTTPQE